MSKNHKQCMIKVLNAIENDLEYITLEDLIKISGYSYYHFHRIFLTLVGESLKKYIKRLRLEKAVNSMRIQKCSITKIAFESGYNSSSSFNKAFKDMFGVNPSDYKKTDKKNFKEYKMIEPIRIQDFTALDVYSVRHTGDYNKCEVAWNEIIAFCEKNSLFNQNTMVFGVSHDDPEITDVEKLRYDACISKSKDVKLEGNVEIRTIEGGNYAVFLHMGAYEKLIDTYNSIFGSWLGKNKIELRDVPCFEQYMNSPEETAPENLLTEIYIPVK